MIRFFSKIRKRLLSNSRFNKYLIYAFGEIILVMIGILLALQVNTWNNKRIEQNKMKNYFSKIHGEIVFSLKDITQLKEALDTLIIENKNSLHILQQKNKDSLSLLKHSIGALGTAYASNIKLPIIEEFIKQGLISKIENNELKLRFQNIVIILSDLTKMDNYIDAQYSSSIEPFFYKKINYSNVVHSGLGSMVIGGPETDYQQFHNDLELWNLLNFKIETTDAHLLRLVYLISQLNETLPLLKEEINN